MSTGVSILIMTMVTLNLVLIFLLFVWGPIASIPTDEDGTTGHQWANGAIREGLQRLPRWWLFISLGTFVVAFIYLILYPGFGHHKGVLNWTSGGQWEEQDAANRAILDDLSNRYALYSVEDVANDPRAVHMGHRLFGDNCAACHGSEGRGNQLIGAPDLTDDDWLYGGTAEDITKSIRDGRTGVMAAWNSLGDDTVDNLVQYVMGLSGREHDAAMAEQAAETFESTCAACHSKDGTGNQSVGAPDLTDEIWLHGGTQEDIHETIYNGRQGKMPTWSKRLSDNEIHLLAAYVYHISRTDNESSSK